MFLCMTELSKRHISIIDYEIYPVDGAISDCTASHESKQILIWTTYLIVIVITSVFEVVPRLGIVE